MYAKERHCLRLAIAFSFLSIGEKGPHQTLKFAHKGKTVCCKTIQSSPDSVVKAFADLDQTDIPSNTMIDAQSQNTINNYNRRWRIFSAKQLDATKLPPMRHTLTNCISSPLPDYDMVFDNVANPDLPSPTLYGWKEEDGIIVPVTTVLSAAPLSN